MALRIGVPKEVAAGERRVALIPDVVARLVKSGVEVAVETAAGLSSGYPDASYTTAGAQITPDRGTIFHSNLLLKVQAPTIEEIAQIPSGTVLVAVMNMTRNLDRVRALRDGGVTVFALDLLPRITRAQSMDVLSSQATVAGYRAALIGAELCPKFFPMMMTAAGTIRPAKTLILGAGVAGLVAISTARRLGSVVEAYDVRRAAGEQVRSLGAKFLELQINAEGQGGYARELTDDEKKQEREMLAQAIGGADVVITTANIPGRKAPLLVPTAMVEGMRPGSVIVDLAAESGGNCELTRPGEEVHYHDVTIAGPLNLPSSLPYHASEMYAKNLESFLGLLITKDHTLVTEYSDEILAASLLTVGGEIRHAPTRDAIGGAK
jgi:NAD(P) transhydrogenase subunit alpha